MNSDAITAFDPNSLGARWASVMNRLVSRKPINGLAARVEKWTRAIRRSPAAAVALVMILSLASLGRSVRQRAQVDDSPTVLSEEQATTGIWAAQGPGPTLGGQVTLDAQGNPVSGAVNRVLPHPTNPDVLYAGTVNGGVWRTLNATDPVGPRWTPLTDNQASLSIGALEFDPTDPTHNTLLAGVGHRSAFRRTQANPSGLLPGFGGNLTGLLKSTDAGNSWIAVGQADLAGRNIVAVAARGQLILAAANQFAPGGGLYRSTDGGQRFTLVSGAAGSGLPAGALSALTSDPARLNRFYVPVLGVGVFRSDDGGATWTDVTGSVVRTVFNATNGNVKISIHQSRGNNVVYVGVVSHGSAAGFYRSTDAGGTWTSMDLPQTVENGVAFGLVTETGNASGLIHFSMAADPRSPSIVYVGGDAQPSGDGNMLAIPVWPNSIGSVNYSGRLFRGDASRPSGDQWTPLTDNFARVPGRAITAPHADSRTMDFDAAGNLVEGNDGGVFKRTLPMSNLGTWSSLNGNLQLSEFHSVAWDHNTKTVIAGAQDVGVPEQAASGSPVWRAALQCDGGKVAVDASQPGVSIRYSSIYLLQMYQRRYVDANNFVTRNESPAFIVTGTRMSITTVEPNLQFYCPIVLNAIDPGRLLIGTPNLYESLDRGDTVTKIAAVGAPVGGNTFGSPMVYGGRRGGIDNPGLLYVGSGNSLFHRSGAGDPVVRLSAYTGGDIADIAVDPDDSSVAYVNDSVNVYRSTDAGRSWTNVKGDLPVTALQTLAFIPTFGGRDAVVVGGIGGVYATDATTPGRWVRVGAGLPNAVVMDLHYDALDDLLLAGTLGRSAWTLSDAARHIASGLTQVSLFDRGSVGANPPVLVRLTEILALRLWRTTS